MASVLGKAFEILELFDGPEMIRLSVRDVAGRLGIAVSTASETMRDLAAEGYLVRIGEGSALQYALGWRLQQMWLNAILREASRLESLRQEVDGCARAALGELQQVARTLQPAAPAAPATPATAAAPAAHPYIGATAAAAECAAYPADDGGGNQGDNQEEVRDA